MLFRSRDNDEVVYGINTGFGKLASTRIAANHLAELQRNLVLSHSVGPGEPLAATVARLVPATTAVSPARGPSGVRPELGAALLAAFDGGAVPVIPPTRPHAAPRHPRVGVARRA